MNAVEPRNIEKFRNQEFFSYCGIFRYLAGFYFKSEDLFIRKLSANAGVSANAGFPLMRFFPKRMTLDLNWFQIVFIVESEKKRHGKLFILTKKYPLITTRNEFFRGENILEHLSRPQNFRILQYPALFSKKAIKKRRKFQNPAKGGIERCPNIFFPLALIWLFCNTYACE